MLSRAVLYFSLTGGTFCQRCMEALVLYDAGMGQKNTVRFAASQSDCVSFGAGFCGAARLSFFSPAITLAIKESCGSVPRATAMYGSFRLCANLLKYAAAMTLFATPCSQTKTIVDSFAVVGLFFVGEARILTVRLHTIIITSMDLPQAQVFRRFICFKNLFFVKSD